MTVGPVISYTTPELETEDVFPTKSVVLKDTVYVAPSVSAEKPPEQDVPSKVSKV